MDYKGGQNVANIKPKTAIIYCCNNCDYTTSKKNNYDKHILTAKHTKHSNDDIGGQNVANIKQIANLIQPVKFVCFCGNEYTHRQGLWKHKNKNGCVKQDLVTITNSQIPDITKKEDLIIMLLKQNADLMEIVKNGTHNTNNTINNNSHNKAFNLNFFLNETCKNAMNINEFVDSIKLELSDLMELGEIGYVAGMSKIITKNLNALDETVRPIHCTDTKREIFYIKDEDKWEKEDVETKNLKKLIFRLSNKTYKLMPKYRERYPDYDSATSTHSDEYCKIIIEAMMCDPAKDDKIIRNISKVTTILSK